MSSRKGKEKVRPKSKKNLSTLPSSLDPPAARMPPDGGSLSIHMFMPTPSIVPHTQSHPSMVPPTHSSPIQSPTDMAPPPIPIMVWLPPLTPLQVVCLTPNHLRVWGLPSITPPLWQVPPSFSLQ